MMIEGLVLLDTTHSRPTLDKTYSFRDYGSISRQIQKIVEM